MQRVRRAVKPPGDARDDLSIIMDLSRRLGYPMEYASPEKVLEEFGAVSSAGRDHLSEDSETGHPLARPTQAHPGTPYLYKDGFPKGKVPFVPVPYAPAAEVADEEYPLVLTTGRNLFQYHSGSMTRRVASIEEHAGASYVEINPKDAKRLSITNCDTVKVKSRRGEIDVRARVTRKVSEGTVFVPMHYYAAKIP